MKTLVFLALSIVCLGCSIRQMAVNSVADALGSESDLFASDSDPELIRDAVPFGLKLYEALLREAPENEELLVATAAGFTQYSYAFVQFDAEKLSKEEPAKARKMKERAKNLFLRGRSYAIKALELRHNGIFSQLFDQPEKAVLLLTGEDVPAAYWVGASWAAAAAVSKDLELVSGLHIIDKLMRRLLELDPDFSNGALHEFFIAFDGGRSPAMGGSPDRAREHFEAAVKLTDGKKAGPYVSLAENVSVASQNLIEFKELLTKALAVDPDAAPAYRLENMIAQERARWLLTRTDDLFLVTEEEILE